MIAIVNKGELLSGAEKGSCMYEVSINREFITWFTHHRDDGLAACLLKASLAVAEREKKDDNS